MKRKLLLLVALLVTCALGMRADDVFKPLSGKITNPSFEDAQATVADQSDKDPLTTGWKFSQSNGRAAIYNSGSTDNMTYGASSASAGSYFLRIRSAGSNDAAGTQTVQHKSAFSLDKGTYRISFDYKAAQPGSTDRTFTVLAKNGSTELGKKANAIPKSVSANTSYFSTGGGKDWTTDNLSFTLTSTTSVTLEIQCQTKKYSSGHTTLLLDNFILEWNLTQSLKDLITEANEFYTTEGISYTALKSAIDAADAVTESTDASTLETQYNALADALALAKDHRKPWLAAKTAAENAIANTTDYGNITGEEKTNLQSAIDTTEPSDADNYDATKSDLETKTSTFTSAKANYDAFVTAKTAETPNLAYATPAKKNALIEAKGASDATSASDADDKTIAIATALRAYYESHALAENVATASDQTSRITDAEDPSNTNAWTKTNGSGNINLRTMSDQPYTDANGTNTHSYFDSNSWSNAFTSTISQDVTLPAGNYLLTVKARGNAVTAYKVIANYDEITNETEIPSTGNTGGVYGNGWNDYSVEFTLAANKTVKIGVYVESGSSSKWVSFGDFRLIKLDATYANSDDYDALSAAISTIESSLGFDAGEYAPYNVASALATAKAFNPSEDNIKSEVQDATAALQALAANVAEVNAVNNGNFSENFASSGWTVSDWGQKQTLTGNYTSAWRNNPGNIQYGTKDYYTMPLKANTYYTLHVAYRKFDNPSSSDRVTASVKKDEEGLASTNWGWTTSTSTWTEGTETFKTGTAGNYILKLQNSYNTNITGVTLYRATIAEVKAILNTELTKANTLYNSGANIGSDVFQIPIASGTTFSSAINAAQGIYDNASATIDQVSTAIANLQAEQTAYANVTLNAPDSEKSYTLTFHCDGHNNDGYVLTAIHNARDNQGYYGFKYYTPSTNVNYAQAFKFTPISGNQYKISFVGTDGVETYISTAQKAYSENNANQKIRATTETDLALPIEIKATTTAGEFMLWNTLQNAAIAHNGTNNNDLFTNNSATFTIAEASKASVNINIKAGKWGTCIFPFVPTLPEGVEAYTYTSVMNNDVLDLTKVDEPAANVPYILKNTTEELVNKTVQGYGTAKQDSYSGDALVGYYTSDYDIPAGSYVLQTQGGVQAFYQVESTMSGKGVANRCYLTLPANANKRNALFFDKEEGTTGLEAPAATSTDDGILYNVAGQQVNASYKGLIIKNRRVMLNK